MAVQDLAPVGHHRQHGGAVAFGLREQVVMAHDLQVDHARGQQTKGDQHGKPGRQHPGSELGEVGFDVAQLSHAHRGLLSSGFGARRCGASSITLTAGHKAASITGAKKNDQPGNASPATMRTSNSSRCAAISRGST
ncbi:hypothetical protein D9M69_607610 [compost metagenome]